MNNRRPLVVFLSSLIWFLLMLLTYLGIGLFEPCFAFAGPYGNCVWMQETWFYYLLGWMAFNLVVGYLLARFSGGSDAENLFDIALFAPMLTSGVAYYVASRILIVHLLPMLNLPPAV